jgi:hypothetical protein
MNDQLQTRLIGVETLINDTLGRYNNADFKTMVRLEAEINPLNNIRASIQGQIDALNKTEGDTNVPNNAPN